MLAPMEAERMLGSIADFMETMDRAKRMAAGEGVGDKHTLESYVSTYGRKWQGRPRPKGMRKQADRHCFRNAQRQMLMSAFRAKGPYTYCEGYALTEGSIPVLHAWLLDWEHGVIDLTWRDPQRSVYWGVAFQYQYVKQSVGETLLWTSLLDSPETKWRLLDGRVKPADALILGDLNDA